MRLHKVILHAALLGLLLISQPLASQAADTAPAPVTNSATPAVATAAEVKKSPAPRVDPLSGRDQKLIEKYYLTKGRVYEWTTELLKGLNPQLTGLPAKQEDYYLRLDKELTDKYFRHIRAYDAKTHEEKGDFYIAKDKSAVWRLDGEKPGMIYGSAEKMLKKSRLIVYPRYLGLGNKGFVRLDVPGNVPVEITAKSMDEAVAKVDDKGFIEPVATGKTNILVDYVIGDQKGTEARALSVVTKEDLQRLAYASYVRQLYIERLMLYDDFWDPWPSWGPYYYHRHHYHRPPPPPPHHHHHRR